MGTLIELAPYTEAKQQYARRLEAIREQIANLQQASLTAAVNLACTGPWRDWDTNIAEGTTFSFEPEDLRNCGDPAVETLVDLSDVLCSILAELTTADEADGAED